MAILWREHSLTLLFGEAGTTDADFLTYSDTLSYVSIDMTVAALVSGVPVPDGSTGVVERSTDLTTWAPVRGGSSVLLGPDARPLADSEFTANVQNFYRISVFTIDGDLFHVFRDDIAPVLDTVWLKFPRKPFLNRPVTAVEFGDFTRASRSGVFDVVNRSLPVAVLDRHSSISFELQIMQPTPLVAWELDAALSAGDLIYLAGPADMPWRPGHYIIGDLTQNRRSVYGDRRYFVMPLTRVAPATTDAAAVLFTWRALAQRYATWADVKAAHATWREVRELVGSPSDVVVE